MVTAPRAKGRLRVGVVVAVALLAALLVPITTANASHCPGEHQADNFNWQDHYFVGWDHSLFCNTFSSFVVAVQRRNVAILGIGALSGVDGYYGNNTHLDVHAVQSGWGATSDGLVGPTSWSGYDNTVFKHRTVGGTEYWRFSDYNVNYDSFKRFWPIGGLQICSIKVNGYLSSSYEDFSTSLGASC